MRVTLAARHTPAKQDVIFFPVHRDWRRTAERFDEADRHVLDQTLDQLHEGEHMLIPLPHARTRIFAIRPPFTRLSLPPNARLVLYEDFISCLGETDDAVRLILHHTPPATREVLLIIRDDQTRERLRQTILPLGEDYRLLHTLPQLEEDLLTQPVHELGRLLAKRIRVKTLRLKDVKASRLVLKQYAAFSQHEPSYLLLEHNPQPGKTLLLSTSPLPHPEGLRHVALLTLLAQRFQHEQDYHLAILIPLIYPPPSTVHLTLPSLAKHTIQPGEQHLILLADAFILGRKYKPRQTITLGSLPFRRITRMQTIHVQSDIAWDAWRESMDASFQQGFRIPLPPEDDTALRMLRILHHEAEGHSWMHLDLPAREAFLTLVSYIRRVGKITTQEGKA